MRQPLAHYLLGLASIVFLVIGFWAAVIGGVAGVPVVAEAGAWLMAGGAVGIIMLVLASDS